MSARAALDHALVVMASEGRRPPCGEVGSLHLSEDHNERAAAALTCRGCPVLRECGDAAEESDERFGVWGARDRAVIRPSRAKASTTTTTKETMDE